jgi:hypothetical protein
LPPDALDVLLDVTWEGLVTAIDSRKVWVEAKLMKQGTSAKMGRGE